MNRSRFVLLFVVLVLVSVSYLTYAKNASAISFTNGPCPSGEARDYLGICFPIKECKASFFAAAGTCKVTEGQQQCTTVNGEQHCTITAPKYQGSPILGGENKHSIKNFINSGEYQKFICNFHYRNCATWLGQGESITSRY